MAVTKITPIKSTLSKALDYIQNPDKTDGKMLVYPLSAAPMKRQPLSSLLPCRKRWIRETSSPIT